MSSYAAELELQLCPRCEGKRFDVGSCSLCDNRGVLDQNGDPFQAPPPFDAWTPARLVALSEQSTQRRERMTTMTQTTEQPPTAETGRRHRMTMSELVERLTADKTPSRSKIELDYKKSPGDSGPRTSWHIELVAGHDDDEVAAAFAKAVELHDELIAKYVANGSDD